MKKIILAFVSLILCAGISAVVYADEPPTSLSFEIAYEIDAPQGRYVFSNEPIKVELITDWYVMRYGPYFDINETYEMQQFPVDTIVAFIADDDTFRKVIALNYYHEYSLIPMGADFSYEVVLSERLFRLQSSYSGLFLDYLHEQCDGTCCAFVPIDIALSTSEYIARFTIGSNHVYFSTGFSREYDVAPFIDPASNRTMIPLRALSDIFRARVVWRPEVEVVSIYTETKEFILSANKPLPNDMGVSIIHENRVFVPLRFVAEIFGATTHWDSENSTVYIHQQAPSD